MESGRADCHAINVGTGVATSVGRLAELLADGLGTKIGPKIVGKYREGDVRHSIADISRAREPLGYGPRIMLEDGIPELLDWVREQTATDRVKGSDLGARIQISGALTASRITSHYTFTAGVYPG